MSVLRDYAAGVRQPALDGGDLAWDEVANADGTMREVWRHVAAGALDVTFPQLRQVGADLARLMGDEGVTIHGADEVERPWRLDPIPLVIDAEEWESLDKGLAQRAELLDAIHRDLYGARSLAAAGIIPPEVVFAHSGFVRAVARTSVAQQPLTLTGTDLGRDADGQWRVIADRTQAPSGVGFAMQNRWALERVVPDALQAMRIHRFSPYLAALRSVILRAAPAGVDQPRAVVLSPGPFSQTAFDQSFLANNLGFPLVEGHDLEVRDGQVWLRSAGRLERIDVIVRRVDAAWSDPLELLEGSQLGATGLTEAYRRGTVSIINGLGAGVLENPGLAPFLEQCCEHLLGESLRLPSVPTLWGSGAEDAERLIAIIDDPDSSWRIRPIDPGRTMSGDDDTLRELVARTPHAFVAQDLGVQSVSPTLDATGLRAQPVSLRAFTMRFGSSYRPLVGGLATAGESPHRVSKDVWVITSSDEETDAGLSDILPDTNAPGTTVLTPRVLDDLYWLGRYVERAENLLRQVIEIHRVADEGDADETVAILRAALHRLAPVTTDGLDHDADLRSLLLDARRVGSAAHSVAAVRDLAQAVRDQVSRDMFRVFGALDRAGEALAQTPTSWQIGESAGRMLTDVLAIHGVAANMMRDDGSRLLEIGRSIERALQWCHLLSATFTRRRDVSIDRRVHYAVLAASESSMTHRRRHRGHVSAETVVPLLTFDVDNPRSLISALHHVREQMSLLTGSTGSSRPERLVDELISTIESLDLDALLSARADERATLATFIADTRAHLELLSLAIGDVHFARGPAQRSLSSVDVVVSTGGRS